MQNYSLFMRDFLEENSPDDYKELFSEAKEGIYKENYYMKENLQLPIVAPVLAKSKNRDFIIDFVGTFIDRHSKQLSTSGPVYSFTFGEKELKPILDLFNVTIDQLLNIYKEMIKATYNGKISKVYTGLIDNAAQKILFVAMIIDSYQNGYDDIIECCEYMFAFTEYPIIYRKEWSLGVQEDVMNYTIEHLNSKYKLRQFRNIQELLKYDTTRSIVFYDKMYTKGPDNLYNDIILRIRTQMYSKFKNIAREYYRNIKNNATQHTNVTEFDDGELADQEGQFTNTSQTIDKVVNKVLSNSIVLPMVRISAEARDIDKNNLEGMLGQIYSTKDNKMKQIISNIITAYYNKNSSAISLSGKEFIDFGLALYRSISTSKDPILMEIRNILNYWMNDIIGINDMYQRPSTVSAYTRGVFDYLILIINYFS